MHVFATLFLEFVFCVWFGLLYASKSIVSNMFSCSILSLNFESSFSQHVSKIVVKITKKSFDGFGTESGLLYCVSKSTVYRQKAE